MTASPFELRIAAALQRLDELLEEAGGESDRQALLDPVIA
jgi:enamine deaminase RidA (YjgF/YER057c/UK114 family)